MNKIYNPIFDIFSLPLQDCSVWNNNNDNKKKWFYTFKGKKYGDFWIFFLQMLKSTVVVYDVVVRFKPSQGWVFPYGIRSGSSLYVDQKTSYMWLISWAPQTLSFKYIIMIMTFSPYAVWENIRSYLSDDESLRRYITKEISS